jgi:hypothetical protein
MRFGLGGQLAVGVLWALPAVLAVLVVSGHPAAVAVILASTGAGLATASLAESPFRDHQRERHRHVCRRDDDVEHQRHRRLRARSEGRS